MTPTKTCVTTPFVLWFIMIVSGVALLTAVLVAYHTTNITQYISAIGALIYALFGFTSAIFAFNVSD